MKRTLSVALAIALVGVFSLFGATRFSTSSAQEQGQSHGNPPVEAGGGAPEIIAHRTNPHADTGYLTAGTTASLSTLSYHGGALINTPAIYIVWYGNWNQNNGTDTPAGQTIVRDFSNAVGNSPYYSINTVGYNAGGYTVSGNVTFGGETSVAYPYGSRLSDSNILSIVNDAINAGRLPYNTSGVYFVLTSSDVAERSGFCTRYCGWHTSSSGTSGRIRYSFVGNAARCLSSCAAQAVGPNGNAGVDGMISVMAHELEEAATDPDPLSGWADSSGAENADKCAWTFGSRQLTASNGAIYNMTLGNRNYLIQRNLAATDNKCYVEYTSSSRLQ